MGTGNPNVQYRMRLETDNEETDNTEKSTPLHGHPVSGNMGQILFNLQDIKLLQVQVAPQIQIFPNKSDTINTITSQKQKERHKMNISHNPVKKVVPILPKLFPILPRIVPTNTIQILNVTQYNPTNNIEEENNNLRKQLEKIQINKVQRRRSRSSSKLSDMLKAKMHYNQQKFEIRKQRTEIRKQRLLLKENLNKLIKEGNDILRKINK